MSLIKTFLLEIEELGYNPYKLNALSENDWDVLITKALSKNAKLYETLILTRCKLRLEKGLT
jgi:hypothetical protein